MMEGADHTLAQKLILQEHIWSGLGVTGKTSVEPSK